MTEKEIRGFWKPLYWFIVKAENLLSHLFLLVIRFYWGGLILITGFGKLGNIHGVENYFRELGISYPLIVAYLVGGFEFIGGISLIIGFLSRLFTIPLILIFLSAYFFADPTVLHSILSHPTAFIAHENFLYLFATLIILCCGPGAISIDYWMEKTGFGKSL